MTATIPNLWEGKFSQHTLSPWAVIRTHAANFNSQAGGLLRADVAARSEERDGATVRVIAFDIAAPALDYRQGVFTAEHPQPGAYPVVVRTGFWGYSLDGRSHSCQTQAEFVDVLKGISESPKLVALLESLIAQINEANSDDE